MATQASPAPETDESPFKVIAGWKGVESGGALFYGPRLVTRSGDLDALHRMKEQYEASGKVPFASRVAPVVVEDSDDDVLDAF